MDYYKHRCSYSSFFTKNWLDNRKIPFESRIKHAKDLNQIYRKLACVSIERQYNGSFVLKIPTDPDHYRAYRMMGGIGVERPTETEVQHLTNLDWALNHLKKYPSIYKPWKESDSELTELNGLLTLNDDKVYAKVERIHGLLKQFTREIEVLINLIDAGYILKGKCPIGY